MSKVLFLYERNMPTVSIAQEIYCNIDSKYGIVSEFKKIIDVNTSDIDQSNVLVFLRPDNVLSYGIARRGRESGCFIITMCDDDLLNLPSITPTIPWRKLSLLRTLNSSDIVWSSSRYICEKYKKYTLTERFMVTDTVVRNEEIMDLANTTENITNFYKSKIKLVYAANPGHTLLFDKYIMPIMPKLVEKYKEKLSMTFIGVRPDVSQYETEIHIEYKSGMPLKEYRQFMKEHQFDIGLAPINDDEFSKCKYYNKYIEYTLTGVTGVYSNTEPYTFVVKNGENGILADNTNIGWFHAICTAIEKPELRRQCVKNAQYHLKHDFTENQIIKKMMNDVPELQEYTSIRKRCKSLVFLKVKYFLLRPLDWLYLSYFYLRKRGVQEFITKIKTHMREYKAYRK